ncbi:MAG: RDD family protein [Saprospiraceae bacterium]|nr:RDD family protein [Saprospiraceae bacterium]
MQTIEITTTQNVTIEYELASLRERFLGLLIDSLLILFLWIALSSLASSLGIFSMGRFASMIIILFPIWFGIIYFLMAESFLNGQSVGKKTQNTKVIRVDGKALSLSDVLLRAVLMLSDYVFCAGVLGALFISTTERRQRLGDMAAGTTVIKIGTDRRFSLSDILGINTLQNYTPQYEQVRLLSEDDMLFIKNLIIRFQKYPNGSHSEAIDALYLHLTALLDIPSNLTYSNQKIDFFKNLIKDYIVLTR